MLRKWVLMLTFATGAVAGLAAIGSAAADDAKEAKDAAVRAKTPLQKVMVKMDAQLKAIQKVSSSAARFKKSASGKDVTAAAEELVKLGAETRKFTEPAVAQKKPQQKWEDYTDLYVAASKDMAKVAKKKDFSEIRQAYKLLDSSCTNCHGLFRPKTGGDEFGGP
jgi:cytochrome c556